MTLEQWINDRCSGCAALTALVPAARIFNGWKLGDPATPYMVFKTPSNANAFRSSSGSGVSGQVQFCVWVDSEHYDDQGIPIANLIERLFDRPSANLGDAYLADFKYENTQKLPEPDGTWQFVIDFTALVTRERERMLNG